MYGHEALVRQIENHSMLGSKWGGWSARCLVPKYGSYVICTSSLDFPDHYLIDPAIFYIGSPAISYNAVKMLLNDQTTKLTIITDMIHYPDLDLLYQGGTKQIASRNRIRLMDKLVPEDHITSITRKRLIDKFVPEVRKDGEQIISSDTPFISRTVAGQIVTVVYDNPGLTVGDTCEVAAGSIGNHLLLSQRTAVPVCAENAPIVTTDDDHAETVEVDDDPADTVPQTDPDEVVPEPNSTGDDATVPNA
jgi:hypothetical protein